MKISKEKVRTSLEKGKPAVVVAIASIPEYETIDEAITDLGGKEGPEAGKKIVIDLVNTQNGTNIKNNLRAQFGGAAPSDSKLQMESYEALAKSIDSTKPETAQRVQQIMTDETKRNEYVDNYIKDAKANWEERRRQKIAEVAQQLQSETDVKEDTEVPAATGA